MPLLRVLLLQAEWEKELAPSSASPGLREVLRGQGTRAGHHPTMVMSVVHWCSVVHACPQPPTHRLCLCSGHPDSHPALAGPQIPAAGTVLVAQTSEWPGSWRPRLNERERWREIICILHKLLWLDIDYKAVKSIRKQGLFFLSTENLDLLRRTTGHKTHMIRISPWGLN